MNDTVLSADALAELLYPHLVDTEDLGKHLEYTEHTLRSITEEAMAINLERLDDDLKSQVPREWKVLERPERTIITLIGQLTYKRRVYMDTFGCRRYLLDEILGIGAYQRIESTAFLWIIRKSAEVSYEKTRHAFCDKSGISITRTTVMRCVHKEGELLAQADERQSRTLPISTPVLFTEFDGFWVNLQTSTKSEKQSRRTYKEQFKKKSCEMKVWVAYAGKLGSKRAAPMHWASNEEPSTFFKECMTQTSRAYDINDAEYLVTGSDGAGWCKNHELGELMPEQTTTISKLDTFHVNQKLYRAFSSEEDRSIFLNYLYARSFESFFDALEKRMEEDPDNERMSQRKDLHSYIANNLDWLDGMTLSKHIRETLIADLPAVFADRSFCSYLKDLLSKRRYAKFLSTLTTIVQRCYEHLRYDYENYLTDAEHAISRIKLYRCVRLGSMEGTNAKVYAARLKVWGCAWSERGAIAMMRIRATIASGRELIAPSYDPWLTEQEKTKIEASRHFGYDVALSEGKGYEPPQGSMRSCSRLAPKFYGLLNFSRNPYPAHYPN